MPELTWEIADREILHNGQWNALIRQLPNPHILQTTQWGKIKADYGWDLHPMIWKDEAGDLRAAALVMTRKMAFPGTSLNINFQYIPKGPLLDWGDAHLRLRVLQDLAFFGRKCNSIFIKIDPDVRLESSGSIDRSAINSLIGSDVTADLQRLGWRYSNEQIQFRNTVFIDLRSGEDHLLAAMKQKTRYNIRLAERKGVIVRAGRLDDLPVLFRLYLQTSIRDHFVIREEGYYRDVWSTFIESEMADILIAEANGEVVAGLVLFHFGNKGWFLYGMSSDEHREKMPNYLLQWEAMRHLITKGCQVYDLWGAPDELVETDPLWGVYRFKEGLGGVLVRHIGAWDLPLRRTLDPIYTRILPSVLDWMRWRGKARVQSIQT